VTAREGAWSAARRVLCVRLDAMGDVLMTSPALRAAKESGAHRHVTLLTSPSGAAVARLNPFIDEVIIYDAPWLKATAPRLDARADREMIARLRVARFDAAVIFTVFSQSALPAALMAFLADVPLRLAHARENPYQLLTDWVVEPEPANGIRHEVERQLALVRHVGWQTPQPRLVLEVPREARARVARLRFDVGLTDDRWVVLHPGATAASRRYPGEQFAAAVRLLDAQWRHRVAVTGDAGERALVDDVCARIGDSAINLAGMLELPSLAALIEAAPLLITNNTGPAHIAAAVGTPVVDLYALTNPQHTPWMARSRVLSNDVPCRNCFKSVCPMGHNACLRGIAPSELANAALELLTMFA
jgi:lipopolysaccharide heptosyltransferase II